MIWGNLLAWLLTTGLGTTDAALTDGLKWNRSESALQLDFFLFFSSYFSFPCPAVTRRVLLVWQHRKGNGFNWNWQRSAEWKAKLLSVVESTASPQPGWWKVEQRHSVHQCIGQHLHEHWQKSHRFARLVVKSPVAVAATAVCYLSTCHSLLCRLLIHSVH